MVRGFRAERWRVGAAIFGCLLLVSASRPVGSPEPDRPGRIMIGAKNFAESNVLAAILAVVIEHHTDLEVELVPDLGGTIIVFEALRAGDIDMYPEYTGTAWAVHLEKEEVVRNAFYTYLYVQKHFREDFDIEWLWPFGLNNTYTLAMREAQAEKLGIRTISDLARHASELTARFSIEFMERPDGWPSLRETYGLEFADVAGMEHGLAYAEMVAGNVDVMDPYATDGKLKRFDLRVLEDDRGFFPPYHAAPIIRGDTLREFPELRSILEPLAFRITDEVAMELNYKVEVEGWDYRDVAEQFLVSEGLLEAQVQRERPKRRILGLILREQTLTFIGEHLFLTLIAVALAALVAVPVGIAITRSRLAEQIVLGAAGMVQTVPTLALMVFMVVIGLGMGVGTAIAALFVYALLPILRNTFTGIRGVDPALIDVARGMGLTPLQILLRVQLPLAIRTIMAGVRTATVIAIGVATLAGFIGAGGLGEPIIRGLYLNNRELILAGAVPAMVLALLVDLLLGRLEIFLTPRGVRLGAAVPP